MYSREELAFQKAHAFATLIRNGITTALPIASLFYRAWGETPQEFEDAAEAAARLGLRVYLGPGYRTGNQVVEEDGTIATVYDEPRGLAELDGAIRFFERFEGAAGGLSAPCSRPTGSRPARRSCCAGPAPRLARSTCRCASIAASRRSSTTSCSSSMA